MVIGCSNNWLRIEQVGTAGSSSAWRCSAAVVASEWELKGVHARVFLDNQEQAIKDAARFVALNTTQLEIRLSDGGWLRVRRHLKGVVLVRYRVACLGAGTAFEGEIILESGAADAFARELEELLRTG